MTKLQRKHPGVPKLRSVVACERMSKPIARCLRACGRARGACAAPSALPCLYGLRTMRATPLAPAGLEQTGVKQFSSSRLDFHQVGVEMDLGPVKPFELGSAQTGESADR